MKNDRIRSNHVRLLGLSQGCARPFGNAIPRGYDRPPC